MDVGLDEPLPMLSLELSGASTSVVYTEHLIDGSHYLFLGTGGGRLLQVRSNWVTSVTDDCNTCTCAVHYSSILYFIVCRCNL